MPPCLRLPCGPSSGGAATAAPAEDPRQAAECRCLFGAAVCSRAWVSAAYGSAAGHALVGPPRGARAPMDRPPSRHDLPPAQHLAERALTTLERFLQVEAASGIVLLGAAAIALIWA